jgi:hypothetical protein
MINEYFQNLGLTDRLWHVASNPNAAGFAYDRLAVCRAAAEVQMRRVWEAAAASRSNQPEPKSADPQSEINAFLADAKARTAPLIYEAHYYFVAWANCGNMLRVLTGMPEFLEAKKVFDSYRKHFEHYTAARNSFEHYHDRLPGNSEEKKVREVVQGPGASPSRIYFGFNGGEYKHSDMSWDITPASLDLLRKAIDDTLVVLHRQIDELFKAKFPST